jgi:quinone-modifying oxidoreductase subunit QmoA
MSRGSRHPIVVVGGGIAGITTAIEAAETGCDVVLLEKEAYLGGRVARMHQYFPKLCPPSCGLEINFKRIRNNPRITVLTQAELERLGGGPGEYEVVVRISPRYVSGACTLCGDCAKVCPAERLDEFNYGLSKTKAAYLPHTLAFPSLFVIDRKACPDGCRACAEACRYDAVNLDQQVERRTIRASAVVAATGWRPYDATKLDNLGFGKYHNVVTNFIMERLAANNGPTGGRIVRPSDGQAPESVAFVQCAGSRDENHLPYCSAVCCAASLKQASYVRAACPEARITVFYIDIRTPGRLEDLYFKAAADAKVEFVKGKAAKVEEETGSGDLLVTAEDVLTGHKTTRRVGLLVLATGIVPQTDGLPADFLRDEFHFLAGNGHGGGVFAAGCVKRPEDVSAAVQDATGATLDALQCVAGSALHG